MSPLRICVLLVVFLVWQPMMTKAQTLVKILDPTEEISAQILDGEEVRKILGNVRLEIDGRVVACDSAVQYLNRPLVRAFSVWIEDEKESVRAQDLFFNTETEIATFMGRVEIISEEYTAFADTIDMNLETSDAHLMGRVQWFDSTRYAEADEAFVNRDEKRYRLIGKVYSENRDQTELFTTDSLETDSTGQAWLNGNAWLMKLSESDSGDSDSDEGEKVDTTMLRAAYIYLADQDSVEEIFSVGNPVVWSTRLSSRSDTLSYRSDTGLYRLTGSPRAWRENLQLTADWIQATIQDEEMTEVKAGIRPVIVMEDSSSERLHQISGDSLHISFDEGEIRLLSLAGNSEILFHQISEQDSTDGAVKMTTKGSATVLFEDGEVSELSGSETIDGYYLPESQEIEALRIEGFSWQPDQKPMKFTLPEKRFSDVYPIFREQNRRIEL